MEDWLSDHSTLEGFPVSLFSNSPPLYKMGHVSSSLLSGGPISNKTESKSSTELADFCRNFQSRLLSCILLLPENKRLSLLDAVSKLLQVSPFFLLRSSLGHYPLLLFRSSSLLPPNCSNHPFLRVLRGSILFNSLKAPQPTNYGRPTLPRSPSLFVFL
jgi:hypothetical protein